MKRSYLLAKLWQTLVTVVSVLVLNYFLFRIMPGDPVRLLVRNPNMGAEALARVRESLGLTGPWYAQFGRYLSDIFHGNLGESFVFHRPVIEVVGEKIWPTILLVGTATILATVIGTVVGVVAAAHRGKRLDVWSLSSMLLLYSMPTFWLGIILLMVFCVYLRVLPVAGMITSGLGLTGLAHWGDVLRHLILPSLCLALVLVGEYALIMRSSLIDVLSEDYIVTARAKGLPERRVLREHAVPNAMLPMVTVIAMNLGFIIGGAIQTETVFSWPGLGLLTYKALLARDYPVLQGIFLLITVAVVGANFLADVLYSYLDPRVKP